MPRYELTSPPHNAGDGVWVSLKAALTSSRVMKNKWGQSFGQDWDGDVFEQVEPLIDAGRNALDLLLGKVADDPAQCFHKAQWPDTEGWRDRCHMQLELSVQDLSALDGDGHSSFNSAEAHEMAGNDTANDLNPREMYLRHVLKRIMAGHEVVRHKTAGKGSTHDFDLLVPDGQPVARVECVELTSEAGRSWSQGGGDGQRSELQLSWKANVTAQFSPGDQWRVIDQNKNERKRQLERVEKGLIQIAVWSETQMATPQGAAYVANKRTRESGTFPETVRPHLTAEKTGEGQGGGLQIVFDGTSSGWLWIPDSTGEMPDISRINEKVADKAEDDQAGAHPEPKWLFVALDPIWEPNVVHDLQMCVSDPPMLSRLCAAIDLKTFDEVWLVWEAWQRETAAQVTSVLVLCQDGVSPRLFVI